MKCFILHFQALSKRIGSHIEKARPYYETLELTVKAQAECQKAAVQFQRAAGIHAAAKVGKICPKRKKHGQTQTCVHSFFAFLRKQSALLKRDLLTIPGNGSLTMPGRKCSIMQP